MDSSRTRYIVTKSNSSTTTGECAKYTRYSGPHNHVLNSSLHYMMCVRNTTLCNHFYMLIDRRSTENNNHLYSITADVIEYGWLFIFDQLSNISNFNNVMHWDTVVWCDERSKEESGKDWGNTGEYVTCFATAVYCMWWFSYCWLH